MKTRTRAMSTGSLSRSTLAKQVNMRAYWKNRKSRFGLRNTKENMLEIAERRQAWLVEQSNAGRGAPGL
jgi:hypothetical protein